jgi:hypothetical protein
MSNFIQKTTGQLALGFVNPPFEDAEEIPQEIASDIGNYKYENGEFVYSPGEPAPAEKTPIEILQDQLNDMSIAMAALLGGVE